MAIDDAILALGRTPIAGDNPCGEDCRYDPDYEAVEAQIAKMQSISGGTPDWLAVARGSRALLADKTKDLKIASFYACALFETEGFEGLAAGLTILSDLLDHHWEGLYPPKKRMRARGNAISWLGSQVTGPLEAAEPGPDLDEAVLNAHSQLRALDSDAADKMGDHAPVLGEMRRALQRLAEGIKLRQQQEAEKAAKQEAEKQKAEEAKAKQAEDPKPQSAQPAPQSSPKPVAAAAPAVSTAAPVDDAEAKKALRDLQTAMRNLAKFRREASPGDALAYQLNRVAAWASVERLPPNEGGQTQLPPPDKERMTLVEGAAGGDPNLAIRAAEAAIADFLFWLTPHRIAAGALEQMGQQAARTMVVDMLAAFLRRVPGVEALSFNDGTPFADPMTKSWIESEVLAAHGDGDGGGSGGGEDRPWAAAAQNARKLAGGGKLDEAAKVFREGALTAAGGRERFAWQLEQARFCLMAGKPLLAAAALEALDDQAATRNLADWEPQLASQLAESLLTCYADKTIKDSLTDDQRARLRRQQAILARLDLGTAMALTG